MELLKEKMNIIVVGVIQQNEMKRRGQLKASKQRRG